MSSLKVAVAIDAGFDAPTQEMAGYRNEKVYPELRAKGVLLSEIQAVHALAPVVETITGQAVEIDLITGSGHGLPESFHGWSDATIWKVGDANLPKNVKVIHLFACSTGDKLGPVLTENCKAFFGYNKVIAIGLGTALLGDVLECDGDIDRLLADGKTAGEVLQTVQKKLDDRIADLTAEREFVDVGVLQEMREALVMIGDGTATLD